MCRARIKRLLSAATPDASASKRSHKKSLSLILTVRAAVRGERRDPWSASEADQLGEQTVLFLARKPSQFRRTIPDLTLGQRLVAIRGRFGGCQSAP
jgi:hypothetical protein